MLPTSTLVDDTNKSETVRMHWIWVTDLTADGLEGHAPDAGRPSAGGAKSRLCECCGWCPTLDKACSTGAPQAGRPGQDVARVQVQVRPRVGCAAQRRHVRPRDRLRLPCRLGSAARPSASSLLASIGVVHFYTRIEATACMLRSFLSHCAQRSYSWVDERVQQTICIATVNLL